MNERARVIPELRRQIEVRPAEDLDTVQRPSGVETA